MGWIAALFGLAIFLSAALLFLVEPMFARMLLPKLGGAPAVWNTCVAFYQALLLAGYAYAHVLARRLSVRTQITIHLWLMAIAALTLPIGIDRAWAPPSSANPSFVVVRLLFTTLGLPFFVLSASGPLLQQWFVSCYGAASNPYRLYAASNAGSLLALLAYPMAIEPMLRLRAHSLLWTAGYAALLVLVASCGSAAWRAAGREIPRREVAERTDRSADQPWRRLTWLGLAFVPSSLMLSVTTYISTDIAAVPLLWVVPLALYLGTLVVAFAERPIVPRTIADALFPAAVIAIIALLLADSALPVRYAIATHIAAFVVVALACHMRLAALRPDVTRLTEFYLWISTGGALGGVFNTFAAPMLFVTPIEYPVVTIAACALFPSTGAWHAKRRWLVAAAAFLPMLLLLVLTPIAHRVDWGLPDSTSVRSALAAVPALAACSLLRRHPRGLGVALALLLVVGAWVRIEDRVTLHSERTFFGLHRVTDTGFEHVLVSGTTNHGSQATDPALRCEPLSYYSRGGPIGQLFASFHEDSRPIRVGVVGLGTASLASYARPGDMWTFFEIDPTVERLARTPAYFTYLRDCAPDARIVLGDARLSLERTPDSAFDVLVVDAFSSDAIPVHLMTLEAVRLFFRKLGAGGLLALHISNRYLDLAPVVAAVVEEEHLAAILQRHQPDLKDTDDPQAIASQWVIAARGADDLGGLLASGRWQAPVASPGPLWTDDYSNVLRILKR